MALGTLLMAKCNFSSLASYSLLSFFSTKALPSCLPLLATHLPTVASPKLFSWLLPTVKQLAVLWRSLWSANCSAVTAGAIPLPLPSLVPLSDVPAAALCVISPT